MSIPRVLSVIREQLHREPSDDEIYIVMFKDGRIVCLFAHGNRSQKVYMDTDKLQQLIFQKRELLARETFSCRAFNRCEGVSAEMKCCYVEYLIERLEHAELDNRAMKFKETVRKKDASVSDEDPVDCVPCSSSSTRYT